MVYNFFHVVATLIFKVFYRKIEYVGFENIPTDKPVLVACNHPSGFIEPCIMAVISKSPFYFLVRGDLFAKQPLRWLLIKTNQIPIFRQKDGRNNMQKNKGTFDYVNKMLSENKSIMVFLEGSTEDMKYLRPLKKGLGRMAYDAMKNDLDVHVVPVGITFTNQQSIRSEVFCSVGKPLRAMDYFDAMEEELNSGIRTMYKDLATAMKQNMVQIENPKHLRALDKALNLTREENPDSRFPLWSQSTRKLSLEKQVSDRFIEMDDSEIESLNEDLNRLQKLKRENNILPRYFNKDKSNAVQMLILVLGAIPALIGYLFHWIPGKINFLIANKVVKKKIYKTSILFAGSSVFFPLYYLIVLIILYFCCPSYWWCLLVLPFLGLWQFQYREWWSSFNIQWAKSKMKEDPRTEINELRNKIKSNYNI